MRVSRRRPSLPVPPLLVIGDRKLAREPLPHIFAAALQGGCRWLMVREKDLPARALEVLAREIVALAAPYGALVSINGNATLAARIGAGGVHLPQGHDVAAARAEAGPGALIGVSAHNGAEAAAAVADGADYVTLSPIFLTQTKPGYGPALGPVGLGAVVSAVSIPVIALGGIDATNVAICGQAGAAGCAVMGAVLRADDPAAAAYGLIAALGGP